MKIEQKNKHIGYVLQKDEIDDTSTQRTVTYLVWENVNGHVSEDYVQVVAKPAPAPALYTGVKFTNWKWYDDDGTLTTGDFKDGNLVYVTKGAHREVKDGVTSVKMLEKIDDSSGQWKVPPQTIFSTMSTTTFAEGQSAKYIVKGSKANFSALDEEDRKIDTLELEVLDTKAFGEQKIQQVLSEMRSDVVELYTFADGQPLGSRDDFNDKIIYLVNRRDDAFGDFGPAESIKRLFGDVPRGLQNPVSESQGKINAKELIESFVSLKTRKEIKFKKR
jgi:hypothetical protein